MNIRNKLYVYYQKGEFISPSGKRNALPMRRRITGVQFQWRNSKTGKLETFNRIQVQMWYNNAWVLPMNIPRHLLYA